MVDVARLAVAVDSSDLATGKTAMRGFAAEGKRTEAQIVKSADRMEKEMAQTAIAAQKVSNGFNSNSLRMASMQLSQVGQQTMATGNFVQALAIQLPDLALGFGAVGIMAGVAAGALLPLAVNLFSTGDNAEAAQDALDGFSEAVDGYISLSQMAVATTSDLTEKFGDQADAVREHIKLLRELALVRALDGLKVAVAQVDVERIRFLSEIVLRGAAEMDAVSDTYNRAFSELQDTFRLTGDEAELVVRRLDALGTASGPEEVTRAAGQLNDLLIAIYGTAQNIPPEFQETARQVAETAIKAAELTAEMQNGETAGRGIASAVDSINFSSAISGAIELANKMNISLHAAMQIKGLLGGGKGATPVFDPRDPRYNSEEGRLGRLKAMMGEIEYGSTPLGDPSRIKKVRKGSGRSSAASKAAREAQKAQNELNRDAERIIEGLKSEQEKYNDSLDQAKRLLDAGVLSQEQYNAHLVQLGQEFQDQLPMMAEWKDSIIDAAMGGVDSFDALKDAIKRAALEYVLFGTGKFAPKGSTGGGLLGGLLGGLMSFDGGGYTGSGSRTGGLDGKGGSLAMVHPNETVIDHTKGQSISGGGQVTVRVIGGDLTLSDNGSIMARVQVMDAQNVAKSVGAAQQSFRNSKGPWAR